MWRLAPFASFPFDGNPEPGASRHRKIRPVTHLAHRVGDLGLAGDNFHPTVAVPRGCPQGHVPRPDIPSPNQPSWITPGHSATETDAQEGRPSVNRHSHRRTLAAVSARPRAARRRRAVVFLSGLAFTLAASVAPTTVAHAEGAARPRGASACETGEFCLWSEADYGGTLVRLDLRNTNPEECRPLPDGMTARSFSNLIDRHVTVYQDAHCSTEADFSTYPGPGTFVPRSPYVVRAVQIWN